jgi:hypothetical protein
MITNGLAIVVWLLRQFWHKNLYISLIFRGQKGRTFGQEPREKSRAKGDSPGQKRAGQKVGQKAGRRAGQNRPIFVEFGHKSCWIRPTRPLGKERGPREMSRMSPGKISRQSIRAKIERFARQFTQIALFVRLSTKSSLKIRLVHNRWASCTIDGSRQVLKGLKSVGSYLKGF